MSDNVSYRNFLIGEDYGTCFVVVVDWNPYSDHLAHLVAWRPTWLTHRRRPPPMPSSTEDASRAISMASFEAAQLYPTMAGAMSNRIVDRLRHGCLAG